MLDAYSRSRPRVLSYSSSAWNIVFHQPSHLHFCTPVTITTSARLHDIECCEVLLRHYCVTTWPVMCCTQTVASVYACDSAHIPCVWHRHSLGVHWSLRKIDERWLLIWGPVIHQSPLSYSKVIFLLDKDKYGGTEAVVLLLFGKSTCCQFLIAIYCRETSPTKCNLWYHSLATRILQF